MARQIRGERGFFGLLRIKPFLENDLIGGIKIDDQVEPLRGKRRIAKIRLNIFGVAVGDEFVTVIPQGPIED